jgi:hypothetical protein
MQLARWIFGTDLAAFRKRAANSTATYPAFYRKPLREDFSYARFALAAGRRIFHAPSNV